MKNIILGTLMVLLTACGSTSGIQQAGKPSPTLDLSEYNKIIISNFGDGTKKHNLPEYAGRNFADRLSSAIRGKAVFESVNRELTDDKALVIGGDITRYEEGNAALKLMIGFGAGSTYFDAIVKIKDSKTGQELGEIVVDKNSWGLGGAIAAGQTVEQFMNEAADKIAKELAEAKTKPMIASDKKTTNL